MPLPGLPLDDYGRLHERVYRAVVGVCARLLQGFSPTLNKPSMQARIGLWMARDRYATRTMPKAYWINTYRSISNQAAFEAYAQLAGPAIQAAGGRFMVRGSPAKVYENGLMQRVVVIEFESIEQAVAAHDCAGYQAALAALANGADRDIRIVEGVA